MAHRLHRYPNEMPLELLPAAAREKVSIAYEFASPGTPGF
jgi:hypothetical protein